MRITAQAKEEVRQRILATGRKLFQEKGFARTTTRDLSSRAGIAVGTLFNYFPNKEALGMAILAEALANGRGIFFDEERSYPTLEEALFALIISELREMRPYRGFVGQVLETALSPFAEDRDGTRQAHLEAVAGMIIEMRGPDSATSVTLHLYWSLYLGILAFWSRDDSPNQEDSLAMLDQATRLFAASLEGGIR